jgi:hypothetical protein
MEMKDAVETTKLQAYEADPSVIGIRVVNENRGTPLTETLDGAEVYFDSDESIEDQLMSQTREEFLHKGFDPLPVTPPYHFNDTSTIEPIYADA